MVLYQVLLAISWVLFIAFFAGRLAKLFYVKGSRARWIAASVEKTLAIPLAVVQCVRAALAMSIEPSATAWAVLMAALYAWLAYDALTNDEDSWWSGRGKKIGNFFKSLFAGSSSIAPSGGSA